MVLLLIALLHSVFYYDACVPLEKPMQWLADSSIITVCVHCNLMQHIKLLESPEYNWSLCDQQAEEKLSELLQYTCYAKMS